MDLQKNPDFDDWGQRESKIIGHFLKDMAEVRKKKYLTNQSVNIKF